MPTPSRTKFAKKVRLANEKEMLGMYVSDHPLLGMESMLERRVDTGLGELSEVEDGATRTLGGVVSGLQRKWTKKGELMAVFQLEDLQAAIEVMVFPKTMADHGHKLLDDSVVLVTGRIDNVRICRSFWPARSTRSSSRCRVRSLHFGFGSTRTVSPTRRLRNSRT